jgi:hypothetical protein
MALDDDPVSPVATHFAALISALAIVILLPPGAAFNGLMTDFPQRYQGDFLNSRHQYHVLSY